MSQPRPTIVQAFRAYCVLMTFLYLVVVPGLAIMVASMEPSTIGPPGMGNHSLLTGDPQMDSMLREMEQKRHQDEVAQAFGPMLAVSFILGPAFLLAVFLPPTPGVWIYDTVLICLGLSGCTLPLSIPLLIYWLKTETQAYFGRPPTQAT